MIVLTDDVLESILLQSPEKTVVMIGSESCKYCQAIKPFFQTMSTIYRDIDFYYLDASLVKTFDKSFPFEGIPALFSFRRGYLVAKKEGGSTDNVVYILDSLD